MAEETETLPEKPKKEAKGWDRAKRHFGTFTDFRGRKFPAYLEFQDTDDATRGFAIMCVATRKEFKPGVRLMKDDHLKLARINFVFSGKSEDASKAMAGKPMSKAKRNAGMTKPVPEEQEEA